MGLTSQFFCDSICLTISARVISVPLLLEPRCKGISQVVQLCNGVHPAVASERFRRDDFLGPWSGAVLSGAVPDEPPNFRGLFRVRIHP